jgi:hypothetical protein
LTRYTCVFQSGEPGKETYVPPVETLQTLPSTRYEWIDYSVYDAEGTWLLYQKLRQFLEARPWGQVGSCGTKWYLSFLSVLCMRSKTWLAAREEQMQPEPRALLVVRGMRASQSDTRTAAPVLLAR